MEPDLTNKLAADIERYQDGTFLEAAMAVFVLTAYADGGMDILERCRIDRTLMDEPGLREFDFEKATEILESYAASLRENGDATRQTLYDKVRRMAGHHKQARTLMRASYLIITADRSTTDAEVSEFRRLCGLLDLAPDTVWRGLELTEI